MLDHPTAAYRCPLSPRDVKSFAGHRILWHIMMQGRMSKGRTKLGDELAGSSFKNIYN
jgi:hypothetical protein